MAFRTRPLSNGAILATRSCMPRYILVARSRTADDAEIERIRRTPGLTVVDETANRAMLVDASEEAATELRSELRDWQIEEEISYSRPGPHQYELAPKKR